jgi:hypothetical protein
LKKNDSRGHVSRGFEEDTSPEKGANCSILSHTEFEDVPRGAIVDLSKESFAPKCFHFSSVSNKPFTEDPSGGGRVDLSDEAVEYRGFDF